MRRMLRSVIVGSIGNSRRYPDCSCTFRNVCEYHSVRTDPRSAADVYRTKNPRTGGYVDIAPDCRYANFVPIPTQSDPLANHASLANDAINVNHAAYTAVSKPASLTNPRTGRNGTIEHEELKQVERLWKQWHAAAFQPVRATVDVSKI